MSKSEGWDLVRCDERDLKGGFSHDAAVAAQAMIVAQEKEFNGVRLVID